MRKPKTLKVAKRRAWAAISAYIRQKFAHNGIVHCVTCDASHRWQDLHTGHFVHGLTYARNDDGELYVLEENLHPQDASCNTYRNGMLDVYALYMLDHYGREMIEDLQALRHTPIKISIDEYWAIEQQYKEKSDELR